MTAAPASGPTLPPAAALDAGVAWLMSHLDDDGCIAGSAPTTDWTVMAVAAAGASVGDGDPSLVDGLAACPPEEQLGDVYLTSVARHVLAIVAAGRDPGAFHGTDWLAELRRFFTGVQFVDPACITCINDDAWAILALRAAGTAPGDLAVAQPAALILRDQNADGGWGHTAPGASTVDDTAAFIEALTYADVVAPGDAALDDALAFLAEHADAEGSGCFEHNEDVAGANADSTAWALLALLTAHRDPRALPWGAHGGPWQCLRDVQHDDGGFGAGASNLLTTPQAMLALAGVPHGRLVPGLARPVGELSANTPPVAGSPTTLTAGGVAFAGWQDPEGAVLEGASVEWWPLAAGRASFDVLLVDEHGVASEAAFEVDVADPPSGGAGAAPGAPQDPLPAPVAHLVAPASAERNVTAAVHVTGDASGPPLVAMRVEWGDGTGSDWSPAGDLAHVYRELGTFALRAWVRDADGAVSAADSAELVVVDARPRLSIEGPATVARRESATFAAVASDPDGPEPHMSWSVDGVTFQGPRVELAFEAPGTHDVRASAVDAVGQASHATWRVVAFNRAPVLVEVGPRGARPNVTHALTAVATDPEGDLLSFAWQAGDQRGAGGQFHVATGPAGNLPVSLNVSDPFGAWTSARFEVSVSDGPAPSVAPAIEIVTSPAPEADASPPVANEPPRVEMPAVVQGIAGIATLVSGRAMDRDGDLAAVEVWLGGPLPVRGAASFVALAPPLPPGAYALAARALDATGTWGPWANATLVVEAADEPLATDSFVEPQPRHAPTPWWMPLVALAVLALRRRR